MFLPESVTKVCDDVFASATDLALTVAQAELATIGKLRMCDTIGFAISKQLTLLQDSVPESDEDAYSRFGLIMLQAKIIEEYSWSYEKHPKLIGSDTAKRLKELGEALKLLRGKANRRFLSFRVSNDKTECQCAKCMTRRAIESVLRNGNRDHQDPCKSEETSQSLAEMLGLPESVRIDSVELMDMTGDTPVVLNGAEAIAKLKEAIGV